MGRLATSALCAFIATIFAGCATNPVTGEQNLVLVSERQELALGQQAHQQTLQQYRVYEDAALQQYVDAVGQRLAAVSHRDDLNFTFTLLDSAEIREFEQIQIYNISNGERFTTYAIRAESGSGIISVNGAAAHKANVGDKVIICAFGSYTEAELLNHKPKLVYLDESNTIIRSSNNIPIQVA